MCASSLESHLGTVEMQPEPFSLNTNLSQAQGAVTKKHGNDLSGGKTSDCMGRPGKSE